MADLDENLDLLDLEEEAELESLPDANPFTNPRPKKPWLLLGVGVLVIALATYIIIRSVGSDSNSSVEIDLDSPEVESTDVPEQPVNPVTAPLVEPAQVAPAPVQPVAAPQPATNGVPVREVQDRKDVKFNPNKPEAKPIAPAPRAAKPRPLAERNAPAPRAGKPSHVAKVNGGYYVQFGSYATHAAAEAAQKKIYSGHSGLFNGKQFVILAAVLPNGTTTYRLRIAFPSAGDANGFCRNAKSDGLDCYVAR